MISITSKLAILTVPHDANSENLGSFLDSRQCRLYNMTGQSYPRVIGSSIVCFSYFYLLLLEFLFLTVFISMFRS